MQKTLASPHFTPFGLPIVRKQEHHAFELRRDDVRDLHAADFTAPLDELDRGCNP